MFSPASAQKRKRDRVAGSQSQSLLESTGREKNESVILLRPKGRVPHCQGLSSGRIYCNGDFLAFNAEERQFVLYRDVLHCLNPSKYTFIGDTSSGTFENFVNEICYVVDSQGDRSVIGCSQGGDIFFAHVGGGVYAHSRLECCNGANDVVTSICAIDVDSCLAIAVGTKRGDVYVVGCPIGNNNLFALGPLEKPRQNLLMGLVESSVKLLGFGFSGFGFGRAGHTSAGIVTANDAARKLCGQDGWGRITKLMSLSNEHSSDNRNGSLVTLSPCSLTLWSTSSTAFGRHGALSEDLNQWGECLFEINLADLLTQDLLAQLRGKVTSGTNQNLERQFAHVDAVIYQCSNNSCLNVISLALLSLAPSPIPNKWELWFHIIEFPVLSATEAGNENAVNVRLRRRVSILNRPMSKTFHPELYHRRRVDESASLHVTWFDYRDDEVTSMNFHAIEIVDIEKYCTPDSAEEFTSPDDSETYLQYLYLHDSDSLSAHKPSSLSEGLLTGMPLSPTDEGFRPFLSMNIVATQNNVTYSSSRSRAVQSVPASSLPVHELILVLRDGSLLSCSPPRASVLQLYTSCHEHEGEDNLNLEDIIMNFVYSSDHSSSSQNKCFTALVKAACQTSRSNAMGKLLSHEGASLILQSALVISKRLLNDRNIDISGKSDDNASLSHRLLLDKKRMHDKLFPLMQSVLDNCVAGNLTLRELLWHQSILKASLVLCNRLREFRLSYSPPSDETTTSIQSGTRSGRKNPNKRRDRSFAADRDNTSALPGRSTHELLPLIISGMKKALSLKKCDDMPGQLTEDVFFAHPLLLPVGLRCIAQEIDALRQALQNESGFVVFTATIDFLLLLYAIIQSPKLTDFSISGEGSSTRMGESFGPSGSSEKVSSGEECCQALASDEQIREAVFTAFRVLEDTMTASFSARDAFGNHLHDDMKLHVDSKRLYALLSAVLGGMERLLTRGSAPLGDTSDSTPPGKFSKKLDHKVSKSAEKSNLIEKSHMLKKFGTGVFFASSKHREAYDLSVRFNYFEGICKAAFGDDTEASCASEKGAQKDLRRQLEELLRTTLQGTVNDKRGYTGSYPLQETTLTQFVLEWLESKQRFHTILEVGECMHPQCLEVFLSARPYLKWPHALRKKDYALSALHSFGYSECLREGQSQGFSHLLPKVSTKHVHVLHGMPPDSSCARGPAVSSARSAKALLSLSKLCSWVGRAEEKKTPAEPEHSSAVSSTDLFEMSKKSLLSIRAQEFVQMHEDDSIAAKGTLGYKRTTPDVLVRRLLGLVKNNIEIPTNVKFSALSLALGLLNLNKDFYLESQEPSSEAEWYSLLEDLWCTSILVDTEKWIQLVTSDYSAPEQEDIIRTTDLYFLLNEVAGDPSVEILRMSILAAPRLRALVDQAVKLLRLEQDKRDCVQGFIVKCVQLAISDL